MKMSKNCNECPASWVCADEWEYGGVECKHFHIDAEIVFISTNKQSTPCCKNCGEPMQLSCMNRRCDWSPCT